MRLLVVSGLAIGTTVAVLFCEELFNMNLQRVAAGTFLLAIALLMYALTLFLRETQVAAQQLKIPREFLEH
jgi:high-affinity Fe2+/Pb2+ permease